MIGTRKSGRANVINRRVCVIALIAFGIICQGCVGDLDCGEEVLTQQVSPHNEYVAALMVHNCGATSSFGTHVNLRRSDSELKKEGSGLIREGIIFEVVGRFPVRTEW